MAYRVTFHGVKPDTIDALRSRLQAFGFGGTDGAEGVGTSPEADASWWQPFHESISRLCVYL